MEILKVNQRDILALLNVLLQNTAPPPPNLVDTIKEYNFPLKTTRYVLKLNQALKDKSNIAKLVSVIIIGQYFLKDIFTVDVWKVKFVSGIGGNASNIVGRVMKTTMTN